MSSANVTQMLVAWREGDHEALNALMPLVRDELHRLAERRIHAERSGHTLQPTALVHEAYLRLVDQGRHAINNRAHFFGVCSHLMRQILVDYARKHGAVKRGSGVASIPLNDALVYTPERSAELIALDQALGRLSQMDARKGRVVELRFFGGLNNSEIAVVLNISDNTVLRDWTFARAWLQRELTEGA